MRYFNDCLKGTHNLLNVFMLWMSMNKMKQIREMSGLDWNDPNCIHTLNELSILLDKVGFLPIFKNDIIGCSVEEHTSPKYWWTKDPVYDPWLWRVQLVNNENIMYGKFFNNKAGFITKKWFPVFTNYRRNGYDFDSLYEDGYASTRSKKIMDLFITNDSLSSPEIKQMAGFGLNGERNFNGVMSELQTQMYLVTSELRRKRNRSGAEYGFHVGYFSQPESIWGYDYVTSCYNESPATSKTKIADFIQVLYPNTDLTTITRFISK